MAALVSVFLRSLRPDSHRGCTSVREAADLRWPVPPVRRGRTAQARLPYAAVKSLLAPSFIAFS